MSNWLKRWESPRRSGRNDKGKGGSARQRQLRKQFKTLQQKLKQQPKEGSGPTPLPSFLRVVRVGLMHFIQKTSGLNDAWGTKRSKHHSTA
ncbi:hypothetical protein ACQ4M4_23220 [Leptolyngbya sp. AN02str]|uniref:hypothetical protein n=1 Tax=Leptolyngbya sp. AN02str TaxID=3423363 RepID=UPI003D31F44D